MNKMGDRICIAEMLMMVISTIINILSLNNIISDSYVQIAFILVILCGIGINLLMIKEKNKSNGKIARLNYRKSTLSVVIVIIICLVWITTYFFAGVNR